MTTPDELAAIEARLVDAISGERRDWHRVEVPVDDISVLLAALRTEQEARARARHWVEQNRDVWSDDPTDVFAMATADLFQKVLNVMDTGNPLVPAASEGATE